MNRDTVEIGDMFWDREWNRSVKAIWIDAGGFIADLDYKRGSSTQRVYLWGGSKCSQLIKMIEDGD